MSVLVGRDRPRMVVEVFADDPALEAEIKDDRAEEKARDEVDVVSLVKVGFLMRGGPYK